MPAWTLIYYSPKVAALVEAWPAGIRASFLRIAETMLEHGPDLGLPHTRAMGGGLFEVRAKGREGIGRAFYCTAIGNRIVILHAIVKKTERTPPRELELARARLKEVKT
ncbi:MAG TPA: type II toxin-antitoxin system RelE/ParE family toxin [Rhodanobacteraceae bacterium]|nr:type II toxin-antitoxin system RelE/ParE family toxin [Rhodanobacteraceae bacterium]